MHNPTHVIIVEDNDADAELIALHLGSFIPAEIIAHTENLARTMHTLSNKPNSIVLLDLGLPDTESLSGLEAVLSHPHTAAVIVLTGLEDHHLALEAIRMGAQDYLQKNDLNHDLLRRSVNFAQARSESARVVRMLQRTRQMTTLGQIVSALAHKMNNPLVAVTTNNGLISQIADDVRSQTSGMPDVHALLEELIECAGDVKEGARQLKEISSAIASYSSNLDPVERDDLSLVDLLNEASSIAHPDFEELIVLDVPNDVPLPGAHDLLVFALAAIFENALAHTPDPSSPPTVRTHDGQQHVTIEVRDHGPGLSPKAMFRAFDPFFTTRPGRAGLGLTLAYEVISTYQGTISLENHELGGALVTVTLPNNLSSNASTPSRIITGAFSSI